MRCAVNPILTSVVPEIGTLRSVGTGGDLSPLVTRWKWKRDRGRGYLGTGNREGRKQTSSNPLIYRATSRLYLE